MEVFKPPVMDAITLQYIKKSMPTEQLGDADAEGCFDLLKAYDKSKLHPKKVVVHGKHGDFIASRLVRNEEGGRTEAPQASKPSFSPFDKLEAKLKRDRIERMKQKGAKPESKPEAEAKPKPKPKAKPEARPKPEAKPEAKAKPKPEAKPEPAPEQKLAPGEKPANKTWRKYLEEKFELPKDRYDFLKKYHSEDMPQSDMWVYSGMSGVSCTTNALTAAGFKTAQERYQYLKEAAGKFFSEQEMREIAGLEVPVVNVPEKAKPLAELLKGKLDKDDIEYVADTFLHKETIQARYDYLCCALDGLLTDEQMRELAGAKSSEKLDKPARNVIDLQHTLSERLGYRMGEAIAKDILRAKTPRERYDAIRKEFSNKFTEEQARYYAGMPPLTEEERFTLDEFPNAYQKEIIERWKRVPPIVKKAFEKYGVALTGCVADTRCVKDGYYDPTDDRVHYNILLDYCLETSDPPLGNTLFHELGHLIDFRAQKQRRSSTNPTISMDETFLAAIYADVRAAENASKKKLKGAASIDDLARRHTASAIMADGSGLTSGIQDIFGGVYGKPYPGVRTSHSEDYWAGNVRRNDGTLIRRGTAERRKCALGTEAFANMFAAITDEKQAALMEKWLPTAFARFRELLEEITED